MTFPLHQRIAELATADGDRIALVADDGQHWSYTRLWADLHAVAAKWKPIELAATDRIASVLPDGPQAILTFLAASASAIWAPLNPASSHAEFAAAFDRLQPRLLLVDGKSDSSSVELAQERGIPVIEVEQEAISPVTDSVISPNSDEDRTAMVLFTSGTNGQAKVVPLGHHQLFAAASAICGTLDLGPFDRTLSVMPLFHIHGLSAVISSLLTGGSIACPQRFEVSRFTEWLPRFRPTWYTASPTHHQAILEVATRRLDLLRQFPLRLIRSASAPMPRPLINRLEETFQAPFIEAYGMTEAAPIIASNRFADRDRKPGSVGRPAGAQVRIVDEAGRTLPFDSVGEIVIRGKNVITRYWNDPQADRDSFLDGDLRTGDLGYLDADGDLFFIGRRKEIINRGGEKICPREVEVACLQHPSIREAVCFGVPHDRLGEDVALAAVLNADQTELPADFREFLFARLSSFKIPQRIVIVDAVPRIHGKLRRLTLHRDLAEHLAATQTSESKAAIDQSTTEIEREILRVFSEVLRRRNIGLDDNFFASGGDSLLAAEAMQRLSHSMNVDLTFPLLFVSPTPSELARRIEALRENSLAISTDPIKPARAEERTALSLGEEGIWLVDQRYPGHPAYNVYRVIKIQGLFEVNDLDRSVHRVVNQHENLRTSFRVVAGRPIRHVEPEAVVCLQFRDLSTISDCSERERQTRDTAVKFTQTRFDLEQAPLFQAMLLKVSGTEHWLLLAAHHIVVDRWSMTQIVREILTIHGSCRGGLVKELQPPAWHMADVVAWQRRREDSAEYLRQLEYWRIRLSDLPPNLVWPTAPKAAAVSEISGKRIPLQFDLETSETIKAFCRRHSVTPYLALLTAFKIWLASLMRQTDVIVGTPVIGRWRPEMSEIIGSINNTLVIRTNIDLHETYVAAVRRVHRSVTEAFQNPEVSLMKLRQVLPPLSSFGRTGLFQVNFRLQTPPLPESPCPEWTLDLVEIDNGFAKFDLSVELWEKSSGFGGHFEYRTALFSEGGARCLTQEFMNRTLELVHDPDQRMSSSSVVPSASPLQREIEGARIRPGHVRRAGQALSPPATHPVEHDPQ